MRNIRAIAIAWLTAACCAGLFADAKSITLVSPNSGLNLKTGQTAFIHWTYTGYAENTQVRIVLWQNGNKLGNVGTSQPIQNPAQSKGHGGYFWTVGQYESKQAAAGCGYQINVRVSEPDGNHSMSSVPFCITGQGGAAALKVTSPNGGEKFFLGSQQEIRWTASGLTGNVKIRLRKAGVSMDRAIADSVPIADGKYVWKAGELLDPHPDLTGPESGLKVVVKTVAGDHEDESDAPFEIRTVIIPKIEGPGAAVKWIKLQKPEEGAIFLRTGSADIAWTFSDALKGKKAKLQLLKANGSVQMTIEPQLPLNIDDYHWNIPGQDSLPAGSYRIRLQSIDYPDVKATSGAFLILPKTEKRVVKYDLSPAIVNKCFMKHSRNGDSFIIDPDSLEYRDPGNCCCRIGWNHLCDDSQKTRYVYRSHLGLDLKKIQKTAKVLSASLTWQEGGGNPTPIFLHRLTAPWNGDAAALFSVPCVQVNPNDAAQMKALAQEWVNKPETCYGFLFTGSDESFSCSSAKTSIHILSQVVFHVETEELRNVD